MNFQSELQVPVKFKGKLIETPLRCDLIIENILPEELKAVEAVLPMHEAQILTYMKLLNAPEGLLNYFNSTNIFKYGQKTFVNDLFRDLN
ncbi:GxxExxY protein [Marinilabilia rubra]|uniref:GxxExxY protein n=1 Tax=Marinilabilia rubra TaxID=2162893 RepID=UPI0018E0AF58|nr:GxxExxY protein [Marinilabilia rubra]